MVDYEPPARTADALATQALDPLLPNDEVAQQTGAAQVFAALAVAEQQRIANLVTLMQCPATPAAARAQIASTLFSAEGDLRLAAAHTLGVDPDEETE